MSGIILLTVLAAMASLAAAVLAARRLLAAFSGLSAAAATAGERRRGAVDELRAELAVASLEAAAVARRWERARLGRRGATPPRRPLPE